MSEGGGASAAGAAGAAAEAEAPPSVPATLEERSQGRRVIVILKRASLETVKTKKGDFQLLNCDDHRRLVTKKSGKDPKDLRPDIVHQELLALLDSPLNKAGKLQIYIETTLNVLIEVSPQIRIPRTFKRFSGLMVQLLHKLKIRAAGNSTMLLKVVKNPVTRHLPPGCKTFGLSVVGTLYNPNHFAAQLPDDSPIVFYIGAMASGHLTKEENPEIEEMIAISEYPLSGAAAISRLRRGVDFVAQWMMSRQQVVCSDAKLGNGVCVPRVGMVRHGVHNGRGAN